MLRTASGKDICPIGIGTWGISSRINPDNLEGIYKGVEPVYGNEVIEIEAIRYAIGRGQNLIDCAESYGGFYSDEVVGRALKTLKRDDLFIGDKLWRTSLDTGKVRPTVERMLNKLNIDYLDLLSIHFPWDDVSWEDAISQIDELIDEGLVRFLGVSNFSVGHMRKAQDIARHEIVANQIHYSVLFKKEVGLEFKKFCDDNSIQIVAFRPLERGEVFANETVRSVAAAYGVTCAQVALAWLRQCGVISIPKSTTIAHIDENLRSLDLVLTESDIKLLERV